MTPRMMRVPPMEEMTSGMELLMMAWTEKESISSTHLRPATMFGLINWRDIVRVVKATRPDNDKPEPTNKLITMADGKLNSPDSVDQLSQVVS